MSNKRPKQEDGKERKHEETKITVRKVIKKQQLTFPFYQTKAHSSLPHKAQLREHMDASLWTTFSHDHVL